MGVVLKHVDGGRGKETMDKTRLLGVFGVRGLLSI